MIDPIIRIFASVLRLAPESINDETSPENTPQRDSLKSIDLVMALEEEFAILLGTRDIAEMSNIRLVKGMLRRKGAPGHLPGLS